MTEPEQNHRQATGEGGVYRLFGLNVATDYPLINCLTAAGEGVDLYFKYTDTAPNLGPWAPVPAAYTSIQHTSKGEPLFCIYRLEDCTRLHYSDVAEFFIWPDRIECYRLNRDNTDLVEIRLLGMVLCLWLEYRGIPALHASAVVIADRCAAFMATNSGGKTSLAASLMQAGYPLLSDDILAVESQDGVFMAHPSYPQMRMAPTQADHFLGDHTLLKLVHQADSKRRVPVGADGFGAFCPGAQPLGCLYLPERRSGGGVRIQPVSPGAAVIELARHSFPVGIIDALGLQPRRLGLLSRMAETVPVRRLTYPEGFENLPRVNAAVVEDLAALQP